MCKAIDDMIKENMEIGRAEGEILAFTKYVTDAGGADGRWKPGRMLRKQTGGNNSGFDGSSEDGSGRDHSRDHGRRRSQGCEADLYMVGQSAEK